MLRFRLRVAVAPEETAECLGLYSTLGAFLVGIALFDVYHRTRLSFGVMGEFSSAIFTPVFFVSMAIGADVIAIPEDKRIVRLVAMAAGSRTSASYGNLTKVAPGYWHG